MPALRQAHPRERPTRSAKVVLGDLFLSPRSWKRSAENFMKHRFKPGDHVSWNSEAGRVSGVIVRVHTSDFEVKGYTHHATAETPQFEIKSSVTEHIAFHKGSALTRMGT